MCGRRVEQAKEQPVCSSEAEIVSWTMKQLFNDQDSENEMTVAGWRGVSFQGRGPCGINYSPGSPHALRDGIQSTVRRGCRYNLGDSRLEVTPR